MKKTSGHVCDRLASRNYDKDFDQHRIPCECCAWRMFVKQVREKHNLYSEVHHNEQSFRGKRTHKKDGTDLIGVCKTCHDRLHSMNTYDTRESVSKLIIHCIVVADTFQKEGKDVPDEMWKYWQENINFMSRLNL